MNNNLLFRINDVLTALAKEMQAEWPTTEEMDAVLDDLTHIVAIAFGVETE